MTTKCAADATVRAGIEAAGIFGRPQAERPPPGG